MISDESVQLWTLSLDLHTNLLEKKPSPPPLFILSIEISSEPERGSPAVVSKFNDAKTGEQSVFSDGVYFQNKSGIFQKRVIAGMPHPLSIDVHYTNVLDYQYTLPLSKRLELC